MSKHKIIDTKWDDEFLGDNKLHVVPYNKYIRNINEDFTDLIKYNEIDCKIMYDILTVIRKLKN